MAQGALSGAESDEAARLSYPARHGGAAICYCRATVMFARRTPIMNPPTRASGKRRKQPRHTAPTTPAPETAQVPANAGRKQAFDLLRGVAIALMVSYHFCFDLNYHGLTHFDFNHDPFWLGFRAGILSLFLGLVGVSLVFATASGFRPAAYFRRLAWLAGAAILVSLSSALLFPASWIFFGVLHFILVASLLGLLFLRFYWLNLGLGALLLLLGNSLRLPFFDQPAWQWIGLMTHKPITEDYVPLLPWFGVVLIGLFLGKWVLNSEAGRRLGAWHSARPAARLLALAGRHSLAIYLAHQPLLLGLVWAAGALGGG